MLVINYLGDNMKKNKKIVLSSIFGLALIGGGMLLATSTPAFADEGSTLNCDFKGQNSGLGMMRKGPNPDKGQTLSDYLGVSVEDLDSLRNEGLTLEDILSKYSKSIEDFDSYRDSKMREKMAENGLSEEQIEERISRIKERHENRGSREGRGFRQTNQ